MGPTLIYGSESCLQKLNEFHTLRDAEMSLYNAVWAPVAQQHTQKAFSALSDCKKEREKRWLIAQQDAHSAINCSLSVWQGCHAADALATLHLPPADDSGGNQAGLFLPRPSSPERNRLQFFCHPVALNEISSPSLFLSPRENLGHFHTLRVGPPIFCDTPTYGKSQWGTKALAGRTRSPRRALTTHTPQRRLPETRVISQTPLLSSCRRKRGGKPNFSPSALRVSHILIALLTKLGSGQLRRRPGRRPGRRLSRRPRRRLGSNKTITILPLFIVSSD